MNAAQKRQGVRKFLANHAHIHGVDPATLNADDAVARLDSIARDEPRLVQTQWYLNASSNQIRLFKDEWMNPEIRARDIYPYR